MVRFSNALISILNVITLLISLGAISISLWAYLHSGSTLCQKVLQKPLLIIGLCLLVLSLLGLVGSCCKVSFLLWIYLFVNFLLIIGVLCFAIFAVVVTNRGVGRAVSGKGYKEYRLGDYSRWLQRYVVNAEHWDEIKSCFVDFDVCRKMKGMNTGDFQKYGLSPTQSGCCKPPTYCGFQFHNATYWTSPKSGPAVPDNDCNTWSNDQRKLCFDCNSCKAGVLANIKREWRQLAYVNFVLALFLMLVYSVGCCALKNNRAGRYKRPKAYP